MSKKDYIAIARIFADRKPDGASQVELELWRTLVNDAAVYFGSQRAEFDSKRFIAACNKESK